MFKDNFRSLGGRGDLDFAGIIIPEPESVRVISQGRRQKDKTWHGRPGCEQATEKKRHGWNENCGLD